MVQTCPSLLEAITAVGKRNKGRASLSNGWHQISLYGFRLPLKANKMCSAIKAKEVKSHLCHKLSDVFLRLKSVFETDGR